MPLVPPLGRGHRRSRDRGAGSITDHARRDLVVSQVALGGLLAVCAVVTPRFVLEPNEGGVSNYGVHVATVAPYTLAFVACAGLLHRSGRAIRRAAPPQRTTGLGFQIMAWLFLLVLVSTYPYKVDETFKDVHLASAFLLFAAELVLLTWMALVRSGRRWHTALWLGWLAGFAVTGATLLGYVHLLLVGQAIMGAGFAAVTIAVTGWRCSPGRMGATADAPDHRRHGRTS